MQYDGVSRCNSHSVSCLPLYVTTSFSSAEVHYMDGIYFDRQMHAITLECSIPFYSFIPVWPVLFDPHLPEPHCASVLDHLQLVGIGVGPKGTYAHRNSGWRWRVWHQRAAWHLPYRPTTERCPTSRVALPCLSRRPAGCRITLPCPSRRPACCRVALPCQSRCSAASRVALLPARRIAAYVSPCPARAEPPCCQHRSAVRRLAARATLLLPALLRPALLAGTLLPARRPSDSRTTAHTALPATPCCVPPYWPAPCCPHSPATRRPAAARPAVRSPTGRRPAARTPPCWQPHRCPHRPAAACPAVRRPTGRRPALPWLRAALP
ncbi:unnamed protein product [Closterium sp. NIES-54]